RAVKALQSPKLATRYKAWIALQAMGQKAVPDLVSVWKTAQNAKMRARAFWVLVKMPIADAGKYIAEAVQQSKPDLKIMGIRAARELNADVIGIVRKLVNDPDMQVRRELAIALYHNKSPEAAD